ncbi:MAG: hypothetical protein AABW46_01505 [Nanoarchaeota archaeon]
MTDINPEYKNAIGAGGVYNLNALQNHEVDGVNSRDTPVENTPITGEDLTNRLIPEPKPDIRVVKRIVMPRLPKREK